MTEGFANVDFSKNPFFHMKNDLYGEYGRKYVKEKVEKNFEYFIEKRRDPKELKAFLKQKIIQYSHDPMDDDNIR